MVRILSLFVLIFGISYADDIDIKIPDYEIGMEALDRGDYKKATIYLKKACDGGHARYCAELAYLYENGNGVRQDYKKRLNFTKKLAISEVLLVV